MSYGLCVLWGEVTDVVIPPFSASFSAARNSHAEGERARKWCAAAPEACFPSRGRLRPLLRRHIWVTTIFLQSVPAWGIIPDPIDDDGRKGWRQAPCVLTSLTCLQGDDSEPPFLQQIRGARKVIRAVERQTQGLWFLPWESHIFTHWWAPIRAAQQLCTK